jgi:lysophospholipase L1-like esterase
MTGAPTRLSRILLALVAFLGATAAAEVGVRIVQPVGSELQPAFRMDDNAGWAWAPNQRGAYQRNYGSPELFKTRFRTNSLGARDREYPTDRGGDLRVLALGDSYTEGWGVEETDAYPKVLEREYLRGVQVWNLGVAGYSTDQEYALLRRTLPRYEPDLILLQFFENDLRDNLQATALFYPHFAKPRFVIRGGKLVLSNPRALKNQRVEADLAARLRRNLVLRPLNHSALFRWARFTARRIRLRPGLARSLRQYHDVWMKDNSYRVRLTPDMREAWEVTDSLLGAMQQLCREDGIPLALVYVPRGLETVPGILAAEMQKVGATDSLSAFDPSLPERTLDDVARRHGIKLVKLRDLFRALPHPDSLYLPILKDGHLSVRGQALVARAVAEELRRDSLLPADRFQVVPVVRSP